MDTTQMLVIGGPIFIVASVVALILGIAVMEKADHRDQASHDEA